MLTAAIIIINILYQHIIYYIVFLINILLLMEAQGAGVRHQLPFVLPQEHCWWPKGLNQLLNKFSMGATADTCFTLCKVLNLEQMQGQSTQKYFCIFYC